MKPRREARHKVLIRAHWRGGGPLHEACILDVSAHGLLATSARAPGRGEFVEVLARMPGGVRPLVGRVEWSGERRFGLVLYEPLDLAAVLGGEAGAAVTRAAPARPRTPAREAGRGIEFMLVTGAAIAAALMVAQFAGAQMRWAGVVESALAQANARR